MKPPEEQIAVATAVLGLAGAAGVAAWNLTNGLGLAIGAGLGLLNYSWLKAGAEALTRVSGGAGMNWGMIRFMTRFGLLGMALYGIFISHLVPFPWVFGGLFAAPAAAIAVGLRLLSVRE